jgi:hypothetical protein
MEKEENVQKPTMESPGESIISNPLRRQPMDPTAGEPVRVQEAQIAADVVGDLREVKVKLPVEQVLRLHYARIKKRQNFSALVSSALTRYLDDLTRT